MQARIVTVADTFDAMTTTRPYQKAMEIGYVVERIKSFSGVRYDPVVVEAFLRAHALGKFVPPPREQVSEPDEELAAPSPAGAVRSHAVRCLVAAAAFLRSPPLRHQPSRSRRPPPRCC